MNKKAQGWPLPSIFGIAGLGMLVDAIWLKVFLPANRILEGSIGTLLIILAIWLYTQS